MLRRTPDERITDFLYEFCVMEHQNGEETWLLAGNEKVMGPRSASEVIHGRTTHKKLVQVRDRRSIETHRIYDVAFIVLYDKCRARAQRGREANGEMCYGSSFLRAACFSLFDIIPHHVLQLSLSQSISIFPSPSTHSIQSKPPHPWKLHNPPSRPSPWRTSLSKTLRRRVHRPPAQTTSPQAVQPNYHRK